VTCATCGATIEGDRQFCEQCGARAAHGVADLEAYRTSPERFDRVEVAPGYQATLQYTPSLSAARELWRPFARFVGACGIVALVVTQALAEGDVKALLGVGGICGAWAVYEAYRLVLVLRRVAARTRREIMIVVSDRFTRRDPAAICYHHVTLRARDGTLHRVFAPGAVMGQIGIGDIGVAFVRHDRLLDFRWFDVMAPPLEPDEMPRPASCRACGGPQRFGPIRDQCAYCGEPLPRPDLGEFGARFVAAASSPAAAAATRKRIPFGVPSLLPPLGIIAAGSFFAWMAYLARELLAAAARRWWFGFLATLVMLAPLATGLVWFWKRLVPYRAHLRNELVVVIRTRGEIVRQNGDNETWRFFVTVAGPNGTRRELNVLGPLSKRLSRGQLGVAHLRSDWLADFTEIT